MNATGEELERYKAEVALDGSTFSDRLAPDFTLPDTDGRHVSLSQYRGKNVAVVFLSAHCYHSLDTLPILAELKQKYEGDLTILPLAEVLDHGVLLAAEPASKGGDEELPGVQNDGHSGIVAREWRIVQLSHSTRIRLFFPEFS